jgi:hypothetical protein
MDRLVERLVDGGQLSDVVAMAMLLLGLPRPIEQIDAIAVYPGLGEDWRLFDAIQAWETSKSARHFLIAGQNDEEAAVKPTLENVTRPPYNLRKLEGVLTQEHALHTKEQAQWIVGRIQELRITSLALFVSPYHLVRAYGTLLKACINAGVQIPLIPMPVAVSPATIVPEIGVDAWKMSHGEVERILKYQELGDVVTAAELKDYLAWQCQQPILAQALLA